jgi:uncharacterized RDD family membrane protein YckC
MAGFCKNCGKSLGPDGNCPQCTSIRVRKASGIGALPKASTPRRLLGSGIEYVAYIICGAIIYVFELTSLGIGGVLFLLLVALIIMRDFNAGAYSIAKRVSHMRVVNLKTGQSASNSQAIFRNAYYLGLPVMAIIPVIGGPIALIFFVLFIPLDVIMILASPQGRRLGDFLAGTQVVEARI